MVDGDGGDEVVDDEGPDEAPFDAIVTDLSLEAEGLREQEVCLLSSAAAAAEELYNSRLRDNMAANCFLFFS